MFRVLLLAAVWASLASTPVLASDLIRHSPYLKPIPPHGGCDVVMNPSNYSHSTLNDPTKHVFCFEPGDYRSRGEINLREGGTASRPRFLRFNAKDQLQNAGQRTQRAIFETIKVPSDWWVIQQLTIQPQNPETTWYLTVSADHVIVDGNLLDGRDHLNDGTVSGIVLTAYLGNPAKHNTIQRNLVRRGNKMRRAVDFFGIVVRPGQYEGENNDYNHIVDNEVSDWGDGIAVGGYTSDCTEPAIQHGTIIDGNDVYLTGAMRVDCDSGAPDPDGQCSCAEDGIDIKGDPGSDPDHWTRITNNRVWGQRPTATVISCGGSGSNGNGISAGNNCPGHALVANNIVMDASAGINPGGANWIIAGNLLYDIRRSELRPSGGVALRTSSNASSLQIQFNTIAHVDSAYDDRSNDTASRCNVVLDDLGLIGQGQPRGSNHTTTANYLYDADDANWIGSTNRSFSSENASGNRAYCFWRRRWSTPEEVCIPLASTSSTSPHVGALASCNPNLGQPFGLAPITWTTATPCDDGVDNDGDGGVDTADPGCFSPGAPREDPGCQNGIDDDGDGRIDFDGGASALDGAPLAERDRQCNHAYQGSESSAACGFGFEIAGVLAALTAWRRRRIA